jgi:hypothetical protein
MGWTFTNEKKVYKDYIRVKKRKIKYSDWKQKTIENLYDQRLTIEELEDIKKPYELNDENQKSGNYIVDLVTKITPIMLILVTILSAVSSQTLATINATNQNIGDNTGMDINKITGLAKFFTNMNLEFVNLQLNSMVLIGISLFVFYIFGLFYDKFRNGKKSIRFHYNKEIIDLLEEQIIKLKKTVQEPY